MRLLLVLGGGLTAAISSSSQRVSQNHRQRFLPGPAWFRQSGTVEHACSSGGELCRKTSLQGGHGAVDGTPGAGRVSFSRDLGNLFLSSPPSPGWQVTVASFPFAVRDTRPLVLARRSSFPSLHGTRKAWLPRASGAAPSVTTTRRTLPTCPPACTSVA